MGSVVAGDYLHSSPELNKGFPGADCLLDTLASLETYSPPKPMPPRPSEVSSVALTPLLCLLCIHMSLKTVTEVAPILIHINLCTLTLL